VIIIGGISSEGAIGEGGAARVKRVNEDCWLPRAGERVPGMCGVPKGVVDPEMPVVRGATDGDCRGEGTVGLDCSAAIRGGRIGVVDLGNGSNGSSISVSS